VATVTVRGGGGGRGRMKRWWECRHLNERRINEDVRFRVSDCRVSGWMRLEDIWEAARSGEVRDCLDM
jgi:hypothetical protein